MESQGRCLCGHLQYTVTVELAPVFNCHCTFCRRVHGAFFTTVGYLSASAFAWQPGSGESAHFVTPVGHQRHFCGRCSTPLYNLASSGGLACVIVASLDETVQPMPWAHINTESKSSRCEIADDLPQYDGFPSPKRLLELARQHAARLPNEMVRSSG